jgi:hypothetical protein
MTTEATARIDFVNGTITIELAGADDTDIGWINGEPVPLFIDLGPDWCGIDDDGNALARAELTGHGWTIVSGLDEHDVFATARLAR